MLNLVKLGVKLTIVGSAVYFTVENSIWDKSEYANAAINKVKDSFPDTNELIKNLPETRTIASKWNEGVENVFATVGDSGRCLENSSKKLYSYVAEMSESKNTK